MSGLAVTEATVQLSGKALVEAITFAAPAGSVTGLIGPNGAGKSTLMRAMLALLPLTSGSVRFEDADLLALPRRSRAQRAALVEQSSSTDARLTVRDVALLGRIPFQSVWQASPSPPDGEIADAALAEVGMTGFVDRLYHTLSGGEQQRVQIARALAQQPRLLMLDEPTNHLDVQAQLSVLQLLRRRAEQGATVIVALHDLNHAAAYCDRLAVLDGGRLVAVGTSEEVLTADLLRKVYQVDATMLRHPKTGRPVIAFNLPA